MHILLSTTFTVKNVVELLWVEYYSCFTMKNAESQHKEQICATGFVLQSTDKINQTKLKMRSTCVHTFQLFIRFNNSVINVHTYVFDQ